MRPCAPAPSAPTSPILGPHLPGGSERTYCRPFSAFVRSFPRSSRLLDEAAARRGSPRPEEVSEMNAIRVAVVSAVLGATIVVGAGAASAASQARSLQGRPVRVGHGRRLADTDGHCAGPRRNRLGNRWGLTDSPFELAERRVDRLGDGRRVPHISWHAERQDDRCRRFEHRWKLGDPVGVGLRCGDGTHRSGALPTPRTQTGDCLILAGFVKAAPSGAVFTGCLSRCPYTRLVSIGTTRRGSWVGRRRARNR